MAGGNRKDIFFFGRDLQPRAVWARVLRRHKASLHRFTERAACLDQLFRKPCDLLIVDFNGCATEARELLAGAKRACPWISSLVLVEHGDTTAAVVAMQAERSIALKDRLSRIACIRPSKRPWTTRAPRHVMRDSGKQRLKYCVLSWSE